MKTDEDKFFRLMFIGSFGEFFLWSLLLYIAWIPILGQWFQFMFLRWLTRNQVLVPFDLEEADIRAIVESRKARDNIRSESSKL